MSELKIPNLLCPFAPAQHPQIEEVEQKAVARWSRWMGLSPEDKEYVKLCRSRFATLVGHAHPTASLENLNPVVDFLFWIFLWDDQFDCRIGGELVHPAALCIQNTLAGQVLEGTTPNEGSSPLLWTLAEMRNWLVQHMPDAWMGRFKQSFERYFNSTVWELEQRHLGVVPDLDTYVEMRRLTSGGYWVTHLIEVAEGFCLSDETWSNPALQALLTATANVIGWGNDILSLRSELRDSGHLNLVLCIQKEYGLTLQEAVNAAVRMHNAEVQRFLQLKEELPSFGEEDAAVSRFVRGMCRWMRANIDWSILTGRYQVDASEVLSEEEWMREEPAQQRALA